jgi:hypothetical protein
MHLIIKFDIHENVKTISNCLKEFEINFLICE